MSYESTAEPIKIGYLMDFLLSDDFPQHYRDDLTVPFDMVFGASTQSARRQGGARTGQIGACRLRCARHQDLVRKLNPQRLDGLRLPGGAPTGSGRCHAAPDGPVRGGVTSR